MAYTPTNWIKGDLITAAKLNKMEQGIANMETGGVEIADNLTETTKGKALDATQGKILKEDIEAIATSDSATQVVSFTSGDSDLANATSWTGATPLTSGETHQSLFNKISTMIKNVKYFYNLIGTTDFTGIGETTITGALSALNTNKLNTSAVVDSLTSTSTTDALAASAGKSLKDSVSSLNDAYTNLNTAVVSKVPRQTSSGGNISTIGELNNLTCGVYDRYLSNVTGINGGWYGIVVATNDLNDGVPTQILFGTNMIYVRHSDDRVTWTTKSISLS